MLGRCKKTLSLLLTILAIFLSLSGNAVAAPMQQNATLAEVTTDTVSTPKSVDKEEKISPHPDSFDLENFTPLERREIWALYQRRDKEIMNVLDLPQREQLEEHLRSGGNLMDALELMDLKIYQWETIQAIMELSDLKLKDILSKRSPHSIMMK